MVFNSLLHEKISDWSKLKAFADNNLIVNEKWKLCMGRIGNIVGKGENAGDQHYLLFSQCFTKVFFRTVIKSPDCVVKG